MRQIFESVTISTLKKVTQKATHTQNYYNLWSFLVCSLFTFSLDSIFIAACCWFVNIFYFLYIETVETASINKNNKTKTIV